MKFEGIEAWIVLDGVSKAQEYAPKVKKDKDGNTTITSYIQVATGQTISAKWVCSEAPRSPALYAGCVFMDGTRVESRLTTPGIPEAISAKPISATQQVPLMVGKLETTDDDDEAVTLEADEMRALGTITVVFTEVIVERTNVGFKAAAPVPNTDGKLHERSKKATLIGVRGTYGAPQVAPASNASRSSTRPVLGRPTITFTFCYRSEAALSLVKVDGEYLDLGVGAEASSEATTSGSKRPRSEDSSSSAKRPAAKKQVFAAAQVKQERAQSGSSNRSKTSKAAAIDLSADSDDE